MCRLVREKLAIRIAVMLSEIGACKNHHALAWVDATDARFRRHDDEREVRTGESSDVSNRNIGKHLKLITTIASQSSRDSGVVNRPGRRGPRCHLNEDRRRPAASP